MMDKWEGRVEEEEENKKYENGGSRIFLFYCGAIL